MSSAKMQVVTVPFSADLVVNGTHFPLTSFSADYIAHQVSHAQANLAVGFQGSTAGVRVKEAFVEHGTPAQILMTVDSNVLDPVSNTLLLRKGVHTAFDGYVDDIGPGNLQMGTFNVRARLISKLATLNSGSLQVSKLKPVSYLDTTASLRATDKNLLAFGNKGERFTQAGLEEDFWGDLKKILLAIANTGLGNNLADQTQRSALVDFIQFFNEGGQNPNNEAIAVLNLIKGSLIPGLLRTSGVTRGLGDYLNTRFSSDFQMDSFLTRIRDLGQEFKFRLIESFNTIQVVPYSPFFIDDERVTQIHPSTVHAINWMNEQPNNILGCAILWGGPSATSNDQSIIHVIGKYRRPISSTQLGAIPTFIGPRWLSKKSPVGQGAGATVDEAMRDTIGLGYAKESALEMAYMGSMLQVEAPLRTDIGLLTPVKIIYPEIAGTDLGPAVYGSVQAVRIEADALSKKACTVMDIGYVRSQALQSAELAAYQHPIWADQYRGGRLDD